MIRPAGEVNKTVFYFPGCGSERLYGDIGMAAIYLLLKNNIRVVLPPPFLCCGFPAKVNAKKKMAGQIALRDTIILSQIREMLGHLAFDSFLISCGTCRESLHEMGCAEIFDCPLGDLSQFVMENSPHRSGAKRQEKVLYHTPCHDSFDGEGAGSSWQVIYDCAKRTQLLFGSGYSRNFQTRHWLRHAQAQKRGNRKHRDKERGDNNRNKLPVMSDRTGPQ